jgi:hypothetical protein
MFSEGNILSTYWRSANLHMEGRPLVARIAAHPDPNSRVIPEAYNSKGYKCSKVMMLQRENQSTPVGVEIGHDASHQQTVTRYGKTKSEPPVGGHGIRMVGLRMHLRHVSEPRSYSEYI